MLQTELGCMALVQTIIDRIDQQPNDSISFRDFMQYCLYDPKYGYYMTDRPKVGKDGDFYTSSSVGTIMGEMFAHYIAKLAETDGFERSGLNVVEWGGGNGTMALHVLDELANAFPFYYEQLRYTIVETSPYHRMIQSELLHHHMERVCLITPDQWHNERVALGTILFSNELLDAFPVYRLRYEKGTFFEVRVAWSDEQSSFVDKLEPLQGGPLLEEVAKDKALFTSGQTFEVNLDGARWLSDAGARFTSGHIITIDYGDLAEEIYSPHRMNGTLVCYRRHQATDRPYAHIGGQDITSHVNFSACMRAGEQVGFETRSLSTQKQFLLDCGILDLLQDDFSLDPFGKTAKRNRQIRQLLLSDGMSELFKVLVQTKNAIA